MPSPVKCQVSVADRTRLQALVAAPMTPQKHVWRCAIVLATGEGLGTTAIMQCTGKSKFQLCQIYSYEEESLLCLFQTRIESEQLLARQR